MSRRSLTPEEKAKATAARKGIASLRAARRYVESAESRTARAHKAVIEYMKQRGLLAQWTEHSGRLRFRTETCKLDWNPSAPPRARTVHVEKFVDGYWNGSYRRKSNYVNPHWETLAEVEVPHWDYDGVDPLVAREPYERALQDSYYNRDYWRRPWAQDDNVVCEIMDEAHQMESCEHLNEYHDGNPDTARFSFAGSRDFA